MPKHTQFKTGISLVELLAALGVIGIIAGLMVYKLAPGGSSQQRTDDVQQANLENIIASGVMAEVSMDSIDMDNPSDNPLEILRRRTKPLTMVASPLYGAGQRAVYPGNVAADVSPWRNDINFDPGGQHDGATAFTVQIVNLTTNTVLSCTAFYEDGTFDSVDVGDCVI